MSCFYQAADFDQLLQVFEADKGSSIKKEHKETMIRYFEDCPPATKRAYPRAGLIYAMYLFIFNEVDRFAKQCADIGEYIDQLPEDAKREKAQLAGELEIMRGFAQYNRIDGMNAHHRKAAQLLQGTSNLIDRRASWTFGSPSVLCMYYRESGRLNEAVTAMARSMPDYYHLTDGHGFGAETVMRAERHFYVGDFENAEIAAHEALYAAQAKGQIAIELCALLLQMRLSLVKGNLATLVECLTHMRDEFQWQKRYHYIHTLDLCEGFIYSCLGWEKKIPNWIMKGDFADSHLFFPATAFFNIVWGKALLLSGQYGKLIGLSGSFLTVAAVSPNLLGAVYTHIFAAAAQYRLQLRAEGNDSLRQALDIAVPDDLIMPFVENGEYIDAGLSILEQEGKYGGFIHRIRAVYAAYALNVASMRGADESDNPIAKLSAREMEVAELAATGLSNLHIAKQLGIESATVKKTLQNIYAKLAINSRTLLTKMIMEQKNR
jgi:LuxR family maltose regulon positive regulatory protein